MDKKARSILDSLNESGGAFQKKLNAEEMVRVIDQSVFMSANIRETMMYLDEAWSEFYYETLRRPAPSILKLNDLQPLMKEIAGKNGYDMSDEYTERIVIAKAFMEMCLNYGLLDKQGIRELEREFQRDFEKKLQYV